MTRIIFLVFLLTLGACSSGGKSSSAPRSAEPIDKPLFELGKASGFRLNNQSVEADLQTSLEIKTENPLISWRVISASRLLKADADTQNGRVIISLDKSALRDIDNGEYSEWVDLEFNHPDFSEPTISRMSLDVEIAFSEMQYTAPRVVYVGEETTVLIRGNQIGNLGLTSLQAGEFTLDNIRSINASEIEVTIPASLPEGMYTFEIPKALELDREAAHIVVKPHAVYPTGSVALPSGVGRVAYDPEREQFFFVGSSAVYSLSHDGVNWQWSKYPFMPPVNIALTQNGKKLLVGDGGCKLWEIDLQSDVIDSPHPWPGSCSETLPEGIISDGVPFNETFSIIAPLYSGLTLIGDNERQANVLQYPSWDPVSFSYPREYSPFAMVSLYGTHMIWAGREGWVDPGAYVLDARTQQFNKFNSVSGDSHFGWMGISANGNRIFHYDDIYDAQLNYLGSLAGGDANGYNRVGISPRGTLAGLWEMEINGLKIYDISDAAPFPLREDNIVLPNDYSFVSDILFSEDDRYLFVFTYDLLTSNFYVFELD